MMTVARGAVSVLALAAAVACGAQPLGAETTTDLVSETLRQQSPAERSSCGGVRRTISAGTDASLVVRTAVELGYNSCQVIRCALDAGPAGDSGRRTLCELVIRGAVAAGVRPDVISRCATDGCDPAAVAAILAASLLEPNYCYFSPQEIVTPPPQRAEPIIEHDYPRRPEASPFRF